MLQKLQLRLTTSLSMYTHTHTHNSYIKLETGVMAYDGHMTTDGVS